MAAVVVAAAVAEVEATQGHAKQVAAIPTPEHRSPLLPWVVLVDVVAGVFEVLQQNSFSY